MSFMVKGTLKITDLEAVKMAAQMMGMVVEVRTKYKAHHDRNDAVLVLRCSDKQIEEIKKKHRLQVSLRTWHCCKRRRHVFDQLRRME